MDGLVKQRRESNELSCYFRQFYKHPNAQILTVSVVLAISLKIFIFGFQFSDLTIVSSLVFIQPFAEWLVHVTLLHLKPLKVKSKTFELYVTKVHRLHHQDPKNVKLIFVPTRMIVLLLVSILAVDHFIFFATDSSILTAFGTSVALILFYEWTHFLIHSSYRPKHSPYKMLYRIHRLHHFRNENYWFGVTNHLADILLGTYPTKESVNVSKTARNLNGLS